MDATQVNKQTEDDIVEICIEEPAMPAMEVIVDCSEDELAMFLDQEIIICSNDDDEEIVNRSKSAELIGLYSDDSVIFLDDTEISSETTVITIDDTDIYTEQPLDCSDEEETIRLSEEELGICFEDAVICLDDSVTSSEEILSIEESVISLDESVISLDESDQPLLPPSPLIFHEIEAPKRLEHSMKRKRIFHIEAQEQEAAVQSIVAWMQKDDLAQNRSCDWY